MVIKSTFRLTVQERILLHLNEYSKYIDEIEVPFALTQEGIAHSVGVVRSAIPRAMKKLILKNNVNEKLAHVESLSRRRKIYHLTTEGIMNAMEIKEKLFSMNVQVIDANESTIKCKVKEVQKKLNQELSLLNIILNLDSENTFNFPEFERLQKEDFRIQPSEPSTMLATPASIEDIQKDTYDYADDGDHDPMDMKYYVDKAPKISFFVGRKTELIMVKKCLLEPDCKMIIVYGMAGIGKTTLAVKLLNDLRDTHSLFWFRCHEWDTLRNILTSISRFLESLNRTLLKSYLENNQNIDLNDVAELLEAELIGINAVFFLDDFHKTNEQLLSLFTLIREMLERISGVKFLLFSRSIVSFYDRRDVLVKNLITELELAGLSEKDSKELLKYKKIKPDNFDKIYKLTKGHPLSLELLDPSGELQEQKNIKLYLEEEVLARLSLREKSLLKIASVFRYPVPEDGFFIFKKAELSRETTSNLTRKSLIKESDEGYEVHDLIRDFFYSYLTPNEQITYHKKIGQYYMEQLKIISALLKKKISLDFLPRVLAKGAEQTGSLRNDIIDQLLDHRARGILEAQYHFLMAKDFNRAAEVSIIMGQELLNMSYVDDLFDNLEKIEPSKVSTEYYMDLIILKGDVFYALGNINSALDLYQQAVDLAECEKNKTKLAELYRKLGFLNEKLKSYKSAIEFLNKSLKLSEMLHDTKSISDAYGGLGGIYWKLSEFDKSNEFYNKCLEFAEDITDLPGKAKTFLSLGVNCAKRGQFEESIKYYERCLDILDKGKSIDGFNYTNFYENLGDHYLKTIFSYYIQSNGK